jgi:integrase
MIALDGALEDYLRVRRAMGYKLVRDGKLLGQFLAFLDQRDAQAVTTELALAWATLPGGSASWHANRLTVVRGFAAYLHTIDPATEVPPAGVLPAGSRRATPYLYSDQEIAALMGGAAILRSPLRAATYKTLLGLLSVTGMRIGEAIALDRGDVDSRHGLLVVRAGKFGKSRELALDPTTIAALRRYARARDRLCPSPSTPAVFVSTAGTRLLYYTSAGRSGSSRAARAFGRVLDRAGRACTTCATPSRCARSSTPTSPTATCTRSWRCCAPGSVTSTLAPPIGTCRPPRS